MGTTQWPPPWAATAPAAVVAGGQGKAKSFKGKGKGSSKKTDDWDEELAKVVRFPNHGDADRPASLLRRLQPQLHLTLLAVAFMIMARLAAEPLFTAFLAGRLPADA